MNIANAIMKRYVRLKYKKVRFTLDNPIKSQSKWLKSIVNEGKNTIYGIKHEFRKISNYEDFAATTPIVVYEDIKTDIFKMMKGESNILWPGTTNWFSKSSGTTHEVSKFIPVNRKNLITNHVDGFTNAIGLIYEQIPDSQIFSGKAMTLGGTLEKKEAYLNTIVGDISAIILNNMPKIGKMFYAIDRDLDLIGDWEEKIERIANRLIHADDITMIGGVPTWNIVLFNRMLEISGKSNMLEIWPRVRNYIHGGVGFEPYKKVFDDFFPHRHFNYQEIYNASEGFFAVQDKLHRDDFLLMLDHGIYYEFIPVQDLNKKSKTAMPLENVQLNTVYALVITTNSGLWRYIPGDTISFTCKNPYRIKLIGRTTQFINTFGEEVIINNAEKAIAKACDTFKLKIVDFTIAPVFFTEKNKGCHEWAIEFEQSPLYPEEFARELDKNLQTLNSDYEAKRYKDLALSLPRISVVPRGTFIKWMKDKGKLGAQNKVPRLSNSRSTLEEILIIADLKSSDKKIIL